MPPTVPNNSALSPTGQVTALAAGSKWTVQITNTNFTSAQINEMGAALQAWNSTFSSQGITVSIGAVNGATVSSGGLTGNYIEIENSTATTGSNGVTYQALVSWTQSSSSGNISYPTINVNPSAGVLSASLFTALMVHEIGHLMGIGDCTSASCAQSASTNGTVSYEAQPYAQAPTSCDQNTIKAVFNMIKNNQNPPTSGGSGGGSNAGAGDGAGCEGDPENATCTCDLATDQWDDCECYGPTPNCSDGTAAVCVDGGFTCGAGIVTIYQCTGAAPNCPSGQVVDCVGTTWQCQAAPTSCTDECDPACSNYDPSASSCNGSGCTDECDPDCSNYDPSACVGGGDPSSGGSCDPDECCDDQYCDDNVVGINHTVASRTVIPLGLAVLVAGIPAVSSLRRRRKQK